MKYIFAGDRDIATWVLQDLMKAGQKPSGLLVVDELKQTHAKNLIEISGLTDDRVLIGHQFNTPEGIAFLKECNPDYIIGIHFPYIINSDILDIPKVGFVNLHPAYLPYNRGWHTPSWAILNNTPIGATLHFMTEKVDMGDIIARKKLVIQPDETANTLYKRLKLLERELFKESIAVLSEFNFDRIPQSLNQGDSHKMNQLYELEDKELKLDRLYSGREILKLLRAFSTNNLDEAMFLRFNGTISYLRLETARLPLRETPEFLEHLKVVSRLYNAFLNSGKKFVEAQKIYDANDKLLLYVRNNLQTTDICDPLVFQLIEHIIGWKNQFNFELEKQRYQAEDEFSWDRWPHVPPFPVKLFDT